MRRPGESAWAPDVGHSTCPPRADILEPAAPPMNLYCKIIGHTFTYETQNPKISKSAMSRLS